MAKHAEVTSTPTVPTPEVAEALSCLNNKDDTKTCGDFIIQCGNDHVGADIGSISGVFEECIDTCNLNSDCKTVSWVWCTCYMENDINDGQTPRQSIEPSAHEADSPDSLTFHQTTSESSSDKFCLQSHR